MKCKDCEHFKIVMKPLKCGKDIYDTGLAKCTKHNSYVDFVSTQQLNRLECVEEDTE